MAEHIFGFRDDTGACKKVAKLQITAESSGALHQLVIIQYDARNLFHFTLHYGKGGKRTPQYHIQAEHPELIAAEDRSRFPDVTDANIPDVEQLSTPWPVQAIPVWTRDGIGSYEEMTRLEAERHSGGIADLRESPFDGGLFETFLIASGNNVGLERLRSKLKNEVRVWRVIKDVRPWVLAYMTFSHKPNKVRV